MGNPHNGLCALTVHPRMCGEHAVTEKQERVLDLETMYAAYIATFGQEAGLTQYGFSEVYRSYIEALVDVAIQEGK